MQPKTRGEARQLALTKLRPIIGFEANVDADTIVKLAVNDESSLLLTSDEPLTTKQLTSFKTLLEQRCSRRPISKIQGLKNFWSHQFIVNEHVLDPRPDSEVLVELALKYLPSDIPARILDLGTGSGCLLLSVLGERPFCTGVGVDFSFDALDVAKRNAEELGLLGQVQLKQGNWADGLNQKFDLVLCNPPYIDHADKSFMKPEVLNHDPHEALFADDKGLSDYKKVFGQLPKILGGTAVAIFEHGFEQRKELTNLANDFDLRIASTHDDLAGNPRAMIVSL